MTTPALYRTRIRHTRRTPIRHGFEYRSYSWFVDLDDLPHLPFWLRPFARFDARDHFDVPHPRATLRDRLEVYLAEYDIDLRGGRVSALLNARVLGYVFNPLSLFWCHDDTGVLVCVVAEVHNTCGGRHCYLLRPDVTGRADVDKAFYVSPFNPVDGHYRLSVPEPGDELNVTVTLYRDGSAPFTATMRGRARPATNTTVALTQLSYPFAPLLVSARIRRQGIALWLRRLPLAPRPTGRRRQETSQ
ncbi:MAG: DUF1365 domain-containing protein [Rhodococcus sp. (in: high G+C Gram-positive bacteria)]|uniref:DUF1365 domain-containing protein n=1 Tax=Rhodococcus sp. TaxID=1831 RepID=UPI003BB6AA11